MIRSCGVAMAVAVAALAASVFVASPPSYAEGAYRHRAALSLSPSSQLLPGTQVGFVGSGFPPGLALRLEECDQEGPVVDSRCTAIADSLFLSGPDGSVRGSATIVSGPVGTTAGSTCPVARDQASGGPTCVVVLAATSGSGWYGVAPITFSPTVPVPAGAPPTTTPPPKAMSPQKTHSTAAGRGRAAGGPKTRGADPVARRKPAPVAAPSADPGPFRWPVWLAVMACAAAGTAILRAARGRRRRTRAPVPSGL